MSNIQPTNYRSKAWKIVYEGIPVPDGIAVFVEDPLGLRIKIIPYEKQERRNVDCDAQEYLTQSRTGLHQ
jgi:hypothetical protein